MVFHLVVVGRVRDADLRAACDAYVERIRYYVKLQIHELSDAKGSREERAVLRTQGKRILSAVGPFPTRVALSRTGTCMSSRGFAQQLDRWRRRAQDVAFVIGGAFGVHDDVQAACASVLSLSTMTLPHELARVVLLEQIYRGFTILNREPYHKGA